MKRSVPVLAACAIVGFCSRPAAPEVGPHEDPSQSGSVGLFTVPRATTLPKHEITFGAYYETLSREEGASNVERGGLFGAYGLGERFEVFGSIEPRDGVRRDFVREDAFGIARSFAPRLNDHPFADRHFQHGLGDLRLGVKAKLFGAPDIYSGVAADLVFKLPTSDDDDGIGTGKLEWGGDVIGSYEAAEMVGLNGYFGIYSRTDPDAFSIADEMRWGLGVQVPTRSTVQGIVELYGVRYINEPDLSFTPVGLEDYAIIQGGVRVSLANGLTFSGGVNRNLTIDDPPGGEIEKIGSFVEVSYTLRPRARALPPNQPPILTCRAETSGVRRGESVRIFAEARDPDGDPVSVRWSVSEGSVTPSGGTATTWNSAGSRSSSVTITATASDGRGQSVTCQVVVQIESAPAPVPAAPSVRRSQCSEFAAGSARLDNRCKAVLDDVALDLRSSPRATLRIVGHADAGSDGERRADVARQRAENARSYLVQTHSIDASRIRVESAGSDHPAGGAGQNRRIELEVTIP